MATKNASSTKKSTGFTDDEKAAMQARVQELKASSRRSKGDERADGEREVLAKIESMPEPDRSMGQRIHKLVTTTDPTLVPRTYYGMPAYAKEGKVICFFKPKSKFKVRYATFEFNYDAKLDDGDMWPVSFAVLELNTTTEDRITELLKTAVS